jgi:nucleotide-binding universal stress UspA family protein
MRVLVAIDRGPVSEEVLAAAAHLIGEADEAHLLTVVHPKEVRETVPHHGGAHRSEQSYISSPGGQLMESRISVTVPAEDATQAVERVRTELARDLHELAARLLPDVECHTHVEVDEDAASAILQQARRLEVHGIAIGTRERGSVKRALLGSVAEEVMRHAPVPVLIVREGLEIPRA